MRHGREILQQSICVGLIWMINGCAVGPNYSKPDPAVPDQWQQDLRYGLRSGCTPEEYWREFDDPVLTELIERAAEKNTDLRIAWWNLEQARARVGEVTGEFFPRVDADANYTRSRASKYGPGAPAPIPIPNSNEVVYPNPKAGNLTTIGGTASWEIDVFGRIRRTYESVLASKEASLENYYDVMVILNAEVATSYIQARTLQKRLKIAQANIESQQKTLELAKARYESGLVPALDVAQARANLSATQASVPTLRAELRRVFNRLDVLLGEHPGTVAEQLIQDAGLPETPVDIAMGLPADMVRRRPDIRRAERQLAAQTALIGVATSELYPFFTLTGGLHLQAVNTGDLGRAYSAAYSFGPQLTWNLFDGFRIRNRIRLEEAATQQALVNYERTILLALQEIEDAANDYVHEIDRRSKLGESVASLEESVRLVENQYRNGLTDFQNVLDMQRSLFVQQDNLAVSEGLAIQNLIRIYRAAGGGWKTGEQACTQPVCATMPADET
ncbi:MAG: efflux transporter outer membrane subunit [Phycisphaerae bacterium]|jgi:multidrug efflux system outer membrane protein|nr:efflux transporter outer membrane subunit [Phycisphaerae bacterium]